MLLKYSNNIKKTWGVLNDVIKKKRCISKINDKFVGTNGEHITDKGTISNGFNDFFVNVGPKLANTIKVPEGTVQDVYSFMCDPIEKSMFIEPVLEQEIISIVKNSKNKSSSDCYGLNMSVLKQVIDNVVKPFTHICNQSFSEGTFPDRLK